jgi:hypothetical protein
LRCGRGRCRNVVVSIHMGGEFIRVRPHSLSALMFSNTSLEPTPITPGSFRFGFPVGGSHRRRGSVLGR